MLPRRIMLVAGEPSGDRLGAELVEALKQMPSLRKLAFPPKFFGAGGPQMARAGVTLTFDLTAHAVMGVWDPMKNLVKFRRFLKQLVEQARQLQPDVLILIDSSGFNLRLAAAIKRLERRYQQTFNNWCPWIVFYVSPQVWASREGRVRQIERDIDLMLTIFPFEKEWYAKRAPNLRVVHVGHPLIDRYAGYQRKIPRRPRPSNDPKLVLLPGSREWELRNHLPLMQEAVSRMRVQKALAATVIVQNEPQAELARSLLPPESDLDVRVSQLPEALTEADLALASSGTVTLECAYFGLPTVVVYKTAWLTYQIGRRFVHVDYLAMPNILAGESIYPELIQDDATPETLSATALELLNDPERQREMQAKLAHVIHSLGPPGANRRAAEAILRFLGEKQYPSFKSALSTNPPAPTASPAPASRE